MVRGVLTQHVMEAVSAEVFGGASGQALVEETLGQLEHFSMPDERSDCSATFDVGTPAVRPEPGCRKYWTGRRPSSRNHHSLHRARGGRDIGRQSKYNGYAHSFAGMGIQFLFFAVIDLGMGILLERERGLWKRFRARRCRG